MFAIFYVSGQFIVGTMLGLSLGMVSTENSVFNRQTFLEGFTHPGDWYRVLAIFIGGMCCANSDFLAACACTRLPFAVVVPIFMVCAIKFLQLYITTYNSVCNCRDGLSCKPQF